MNAPISERIREVVGLDEGDGIPTEPKGLRKISCINEIATYKMIMQSQDSGSILSWAYYNVSKELHAEKISKVTESRKEGLEILKTEVEAGLVLGLSKKASRTRAVEIVNKICGMDYGDSIKRKSTESQGYKDKELAKALGYSSTREMNNSFMLIGIHAKCETGWKLTHRGVEICSKGQGKRRWWDMEKLKKIISEYRNPQVKNSKDILTG